MNKEIKEKILKEVCKKYGYDSLDNATMMGAELIQEISKHYEEKLTQTNLRNHSREQNIKKVIEELKQKVKDEAKKTNLNILATKEEVFDYDTKCFINYLDEILENYGQIPECREKGVKAKECEDKECNFHLDKGSPSDTCNHIVKKEIGSDGKPRYKICQKCWEKQNDL